MLIWPLLVSIIALSAALVVSEQRSNALADRLAAEQRTRAELLHLVKEQAAA